MKPLTDLVRLNRLLNAIGVLSVAGVLATVWFFGLRSARQDSEQLADRRAQLLRFLDTEENLVGENRAQQAAAEKQRKEMEILLSRIPREAREVDFLELLSRTAEQTGVELRNFQPLAGQSGEHIGTSQVRISGSGGYGNLVEFLNRIRQLPRMNRVAQLELGVVDSSRNVCSIELTLDLFFDVRPFEKSTIAS